MPAEFQLRPRNLLGVMRSMPDRTLASSGSLDEVQEHFRDRVTALAQMNGLFSWLEESIRISFDDLPRAGLARQGVMDGKGMNRWRWRDPKAFAFVPL